MSNVKHDAESQYFSGQGVLQMGVQRSGVFVGYESVGNVIDAMIQVSTSVVEHRGSQDGQRAIDKRIQTETNVKLMATMESFSPKNIARNLRGSSGRVAAATGASESVSVLPGLIASLNRIRLSNVVITGMSDYVNDTTAWDFKVNADAGSIMLNDGSGVLPATLGATPSGVTVGATTTITVNNSWVVGDNVLLYGFTGADAADLNGKTFPISTRTATQIVIALNTTGKTITTAVGTRALNLDRTLTVTVTYDHEEQYAVEALTEPLKEVPVRFEGLNTADENMPVVIEVWKFSTDPLKELSLISDNFGQMAVEGSVLADNSKGTGLSKYFKVRKLDR